MKCDKEWIDRRSKIARRCVRTLDHNGRCYSRTAKGGRPLSIKPGDRFGHVVVVSVGDLFGPSSKPRQRRYMCRLLCGHVVPLRWTDAKKGTQKACGECTSGGFYSSEETVSRTYFKSYKSGALIRDIPFDLTEEQFFAKTKRPCAYCGDEPSRAMFSHQKAKRGSKILRNGLDRVNNELGYTDTNTVPCCWLCNHMKGTMTSVEFIGRCRAVSSFRRDA